MRTAAILSVVALTVVGCGSGATDSAEDFEGEERAVARTIEQLEDAGRDSAERRICADLLADSLLDRLEKAGTNCTTAVREALEDTDSFDIKVDDVTINGDSATARVTSGRSGGNEQSDTLTLQRDGARWKISSLTAG